MVKHQSTHRLDRVFAGLSDPTRRAILARLAAGERTIGDLASGFDMSLPAVSKHVRVLERAGLARLRRDGRTRRASLIVEPLREASDWIASYRRFWDFQLDLLESYLTPEAQDPWTPPTAPPKSSSSAAPSPRHGSASSRRGRGRRS